LTEEKSKGQKVELFDGSEFTIEKGFTVPPEKHLGRWDPLMKVMEIGDSVSMSSKQANSFASAIKARGGKARYRSAKNGNARIWLVKKPEKLKIA
jgi:hypothetical protein